MNEMDNPFDLKMPEIKKPGEFTTLDNYILIPTINLEYTNESLLRFYKDNDIEIKLRLHSKSEYEFSGKIIELFGLNEKTKEDDKEEAREDAEFEEELKSDKTKGNIVNNSNMNVSVGYIPPKSYVGWEGYYIILQDDDDKIKLFLSDIDHRTIMPKDVEAIKPLFIFERENIPPKLRFEILEKYNHTCQYCGRKAPEVELEIDHIIPISKGGQTIAENITVSCRKCNNGKSNKILNQLREKLKWMMKKH